MSWARNAAICEDETLIDAYRTALRILERHVAAVPPSQRLEIVGNDISSLASKAFSQCFAHGALETAVELLEQGRTVLWSHLSRFQTPLDDLSGLNTLGESLSVEFRKLSTALRQTQDPLEFYKLKKEWEDVIKRIREFPGFSRFLLYPLYADLEKAAQCGPVIIVNASVYSCEALIIFQQRYPFPIPFELSPAALSRLSEQFREVTEGPAPAEQKRNEIVFILRKLWTAVVEPIVDALVKRFFLPRRSRIWLCPTGEFMRLPLHAAGLYSKKGAKLTDYYVPSYTPTLAALIRSRQGITMSQHDHIRERFLAIGQHSPYEGKELRSVPDELNALKGLVAPTMDFTVLEGDAATTGNVLEAFKRNGWVHLACHGRPNPNEPFESSFAMRNGPLTLTEIIKANLPSAEFAFLSACHTAVPDEWTPDEMIHLAAGMQFSGFRGVIGTMWAVDDSVVKYMVTAFYDELLKDGRKLDASRAAEALHKAIKRVSNDKTVPLEQRIVLIHIGI
ncbi:hypothetical protein M422DRAFT_181687 [Sphaerobolus stellatus SS14]|uniref:CHAT domain-containing protein n=1 Tax=Sphaerobolus stellatus (strain SS14) TaxID=990650 RepID=A0A0C9VBQ8_SPHS4|nr:hypothetical protein M422DRAFT_181687 [Sphaerobolus stellatus SS14]